MLPHPHSPSPTADQDGDNDDPICALDDNLRELILMLAHLDVRELVRTGMLSKQWHGPWRRFPILDLAGDVQQYIAIVNDVLQQCEGTTSEACIDEVKIPLLLDANALRRQRYHLLTPAMQTAEEWIRYAMRNQVKGF